MAVYNLSVIHLGNLADLDPVDCNESAENQPALLDTYYGAADPAAGHITTLTVYDDNDDQRITSNDRSDTEAIVFDLGSGPQTTVYDALFNVRATVSFGPGSGQPYDTGLAGNVQTATGDVFLVMVDDGEGWGSNPHDDFPIDSIQINSISAFGVQQMATASDTQSFVPCFGAGTLVETSRGACPVETLRVDDMVQTLDNGLQPIRWVGRRLVSAARLKARPRLLPVLIMPGGLGDNRPQSALMVSPQHRLLLASRIMERVAGTREILAPARKLVGMPGIRRVGGSASGVQYHNFACDRHDVVLAHGLPSETFLVGPCVERAMDNVAKGGMARFDPAQALLRAGPVTPARPLFERRASLGNLLERHRRHRRPLLSLH